MSMQQQHQNTAPAKPHFSRDPNKAMQQMMDTIDALRGVYAKETDALERMDTKAFLSLQDDKEKTALAYEAGIREMVARKDDIKKADPALRANLNKMQEDFSELSLKNMLALKRMSRATERLHGAIREAAMQEVKKMRTFSYGENGQIEDNDKKQISVSLSEEA